MNWYSDWDKDDELNYNFLQRNDPEFSERRMIGFFISENIFYEQWVRAAKKFYDNYHTVPLEIIAHPDIWEEEDDIDEISVNMKFEFADKLCFIGTYCSCVLADRLDRSCYERTDYFKDIIVQRLKDSLICFPDFTENVLYFGDIPVKVKTDEFLPKNCFIMDLEFNHKLIENNERLIYK